MKHRFLVGLGAEKKEDEWLTNSRVLFGHFDDESSELSLSGSVISGHQSMWVALSKRNKDKFYTVDCNIHALRSFELDESGCREFGVAVSSCGDDPCHLTVSPDGFISRFRFCMSSFLSAN